MRSGRSDWGELRWYMLVLFIVPLSCITEPTDPVEFGRICIPATSDCPGEVLLHRDAVGRNQLDYTVENLGGSEASVRVSAIVPPSLEQDAGDVGDGGSVTTGDVIVERTHRVNTGESDGNRWTPQNLGTRSEFQFRARCINCEVSIDYVLTSVPLECIQDSECSSGWFCDTAIPGRCVECRADEDCDVDQRCDKDLGRCTPPKDAGGCNVVAQPSDIMLVAALLLFVLGLLRRRWAVLITALVLQTAAFEPDAWAEAPVASLSIGTGARLFTGELGDNTDMGIGLVVSQELRWKFIGEAVRLDASYFLATPDSPPYSNDFRTTSVTIGPRGYLPFSDWQIVFGVDYVRLGISSNSLIRITGVETGFNGVAGVLGGRFQWSGLEGRLELGYEHLFGLPGAMLTLDLAIALSTAF